MERRNKYIRKAYKVAKVTKYVVYVIKSLIDLLG